MKNCTKEIMYSFLGKTLKRAVDVYVVMRSGSPLAQARDDRCCFVGQNGRKKCCDDELKHGWGAKGGVAHVFL